MMRDVHPLDINTLPIKLRRWATDTREHLCDLLARDFWVWSASVAWSRTAGAANLRVLIGGAAGVASD